MRNLVRIKFGSRTSTASTPASDLDFESIYMPDGRAILLQRVKGSISTRAKVEGKRTSPARSTKNLSACNAISACSPKAGVTTDVLFAPEWSMVEAPSDEWREIVANRNRLITRKSAAFVGYCRQQANKYGIKGSRVAAARRAIGVLEHAVETRGATAKLGAIDLLIRETAEVTEHMSIVPIDHVISQERRTIGRSADAKCPIGSIKNARDMMAALVKDYGSRALQAESQQGVDWKALSHAVRVARQAIEFLSTGHVTFPLPDAAHEILAIKKGAIPYQEVAAEIEQGLVDLEEQVPVSTLPAEPDHAWDRRLCRTRLWRGSIGRAHDRSGNGRDRCRARLVSAQQYHGSS